MAVDTCIDEVVKETCIPAYKPREAPKPELKDIMQMVSEHRGITKKGYSSFVLEYLSLGEGLRYFLTRAAEIVGVGISKKGSGERYLDRKVEEHSLKARIAEDVLREINLYLKIANADMKFYMHSSNIRRALSKGFNRDIEDVHSRYANAQLLAEKIALENEESKLKEQLKDCDRVLSNDVYSLEVTTERIKRAEQIKEKLLR